MRTRLKQKVHELEAACVLVLRKPRCDVARRSLLHILQWDDRTTYMHLRPAVRGKVNQVRAYATQLSRRLTQNVDQFLVHDGIECLRAALADLGKLLSDQES